MSFCSDFIPEGDSNCRNLKPLWLGLCVKCDICEYIWAAAFRADVSKLECPNCNLMVYFEVVTTEDYKRFIQKRKDD